jgi:hypothetical protein
MPPTTWLDRARSASRLAAGLFGRTRRDAELEEELEFHVARSTERNVRRGMSPDEARRSALAALGGRTHWAERGAPRRRIHSRLDYRQRGVSLARVCAQQSEQTRDEQRSRFLDDFVRDVAYGAKALRRNPGFAIGALLTVALALAATTTVFSFVNAVYLRPLDVPEVAGRPSRRDHPGSISSSASCIPTAAQRMPSTSSPHTTPRRRAPYEPPRIG